MANIQIDGTQIEVISLEIEEDETLAEALDRAGVSINGTTLLLNGDRVDETARLADGDAVTVVSKPEAAG